MLQWYEQYSPPTPRDGLVVAFLAVAEQHLGDHPVAEEYQDHCAEEFGEGIPSVCPDFVPEQ